MSVAKQAKQQMDNVIEFFKNELKTLRTGRANTALLDGVSVEVYGTQMRIKELASVSTPEPRQILITPFDPQTAGPIAKSIEKANLNLLPIVEKQMIRINVPPMDESMRKTIVKQGKEKKRRPLYQSVKCEESLMKWLVSKKQTEHLQKTSLRKKKN